MLSIRGLYLWDETIFDDMSIPEGLDKSVLVDNLTMELAELEILYPDPAFMKSAITRWSAKQISVWNELYATLSYEYDPIWNKDAHYEETETRNLASGRNASNTDTIATTSSSTGSGSDTTSTAAFNSIQMEPRESDTSSQQASAQYGSSAVKSISETGSDTGTIRHERREYGNIGVTTTQQMIEEQRRVVQFSMYDHIIDDFKHRFCIMVY